jgi:membrane protease subunit HflK
MPEIEELMKKGQDRLRVLMGGRGNGGSGGPRGDPGGQLSTGGAGAWGPGAGRRSVAFMSFYTVARRTLGRTSVRACPRASAIRV